MKKRKKKSVACLLNESCIYSALDRFAALIYRKAENGVIGAIMTAYEKEDNALHTGFFAGVTERIGLSKKIKHTLARGCEQSVILSFFDKIFHSLAGLSMRCYGMFLFVFGALSALSCLYEAKKYDFEEIPWIALIISVALLLSGISMFFSRQRLSEAVRENRLLSFVIFSMLGARKTAFEETGGTRGRLLWAAIIGAVFGIVSLFFPALYIIICMIGILAVYAVLIIPEFGVVATLFGLAFLPTMILVAMVCYTFLCYMLKLWRGKRTFRFNILDGAVLIFLLFMVAGGIASVAGGGSIQPALVYVCFMLGYFLMVNLIRSEAWTKRCVVSVVTSSSIVALYGIYEHFFGVQLTTWQDTEMFDDITGRVISTFGNPNVLAEYLIMAMPFMFALMIASKHASGKLVNFLLFGACGACLIFTWSRGAWLGFIFTMFLFFLVYTRKTLMLSLCAIIAIPFLPFVLPDNILNRITSIGNIADSSTSYRVAIWEAAVKIARNFGLSGIGVGNGAFSKVYPLYSLSGIEAAPHAHNLFLQTAIEVGIPGLMVLLLVIFLFAQCAFTFYQKCKNGQMKSGKLLSLAGFSGIMGVLLQGMTDYIWYNYRVYLMFWLIIGLTAAIQRTALEIDGGVSLSYERKTEVES